MRRIQRIYLLGNMIVFGSLIAHCGITVTPTEPTIVGPTATISPLFQEQSTADISRSGRTATTSEALTQLLPTISKTPTKTIQSTQTHTTAATQTTVPHDAQPTVYPFGDQTKQVSIYDEKLSDNWSINDSYLVKIQLNRPGTAFGGSRAIAVTPQGATGTFQFSLKRSASENYRRSKVIGVSFWVSGGRNIITPNDLAVAVLGSNAYPYWVAHDTSVKLNGRVTGDFPIFSETRLYYLNFNRAIPANTWAQVVVILDERQFDTDYTYVTGMYIKNDELFQSTYFVDDVKLILSN